MRMRYSDSRLEVSMRSAFLLVWLFTVSLFAGPKRDATFYSDVLPVLQKNCQSCHRPGEAGPMSLMTFKDARPWAKAMREAVLVRKMPPWYADPAHGKFVNERTLSEAEIDAIAGWAENGAPEGDAKKAPKPVVFAEGWQLGTPDLVLEMPAAFSIPSSGTVEYQHFVLPTGFTEDKWIVAAEVRPDNRAVLHHAVAFIRPPGSRWLREIKQGEPFVPKRWQQDLGIYEEILDTYVPGAVPFQARPGQAKMIPAGSDIIFQLHYTATGKAGIDRSRIGLTFAKEPPAERIFSLQVANSKFTIPPGHPNFTNVARMRFQTDAKLVGMMPHMHLRGKSMEYRAIFPTGEKQVLLRVPNYDFNWQIFYNVADQMPLPKGTLVEVEATWDNSPNNPRNPDPKAEVKWGDQSWQEMHVGFIDVLIDAKIDPIDLVRAKRPAPAGGL